MHDNFIPQQLFAQSEVVLDEGQWLHFQLHLHCKAIQKWKVHKLLSIENNLHPFILEQIQEISFPYLISINLNGNNLSSIELIGRLKMASLLSFLATNNRIMDCKAFRKSYMPQLRCIDLCKNKILIIQRQSQYPFKSMRKLQSDSKSIRHNILLVSKMESQYLNKVKQWKYFRMTQENFKKGKQSFFYR